MGDLAGAELMDRNLDSWISVDSYCHSRKFARDVARPFCLVRSLRIREIASVKTRTDSIIVSYRRARNAIKPDRLNLPTHAERRILVTCFLTDASRDFPCVTPNAKHPTLESPCRDAHVPRSSYGPTEYVLARIFRAITRWL